MAACCSCHRAKLISEGNCAKPEVSATHYQYRICIDKSTGHISLQHFISMNVYSCSDIRTQYGLKKQGSSSCHLEPIPIICVNTLYPVLLKFRKILRLLVLNNALSDSRKKNPKHIEHKKISFFSNLNHQFCECHNAMYVYINLSNNHIASYILNTSKKFQHWSVTLILGES